MIAKTLQGSLTFSTIEPGRGLASALAQSPSDALARIERQPRDITRIGLELSDRRVAREGSPVLAGGRKVGWVSSGTFSPTLEKSIAMAYVSPEFAQPGQELEVEIRGRTEPAGVVKLPFYRRSRKET